MIFESCEEKISKLLQCNGLRLPLPNSSFVPTQWIECGMESKNSILHDDQQPHHISVQYELLLALLGNTGDLFVDISDTISGEAVNDPKACYFKIVPAAQWIDPCHRSTFISCVITQRLIGGLTLEQPKVAKTCIAVTLCPMECDELPCCGG
jgi:hypothetical protein